MKIANMNIRIISPWDKRFATPVPPGAENWVRGWDTLWITIETDEGISGNAFVWGAPTGRAGAELLRHGIWPHLEGKDPTAREELWHRIRRVDRLTGLFPKQLLGPVDVALWDIAAKAAGLPLYRFLGSFRDRVRAYAASLFLDSIEDLTKQAVEAQEAGFKAFKLHLWGDVDKDVRACKEVRSAVGEEMELMVDLHGTYNRQQALAVGRHLEELRFVWYEEPIPDDDLEGYVQLTRDLEIPVAALQSLNSHLVPLGSYLTRGAVDIVLIDTSWKGGVTGVRKLAHTCEVLGTSYEICSSFNALMSVANLHTICSLRHGRYFEIMVPGGVFDFGLKTALDIDSEGYVQVPAGPGLGVELDEEYLNRYTVATL